MDKTQAIKTINALDGMSARATGMGAEIRVAYSGKGNEASAYYTDDARDAVETARDMNNHRLGKSSTVDFA